MSDYFNEEFAAKWVHCPILGLAKGFPSQNVLKENRSETILQMAELLRSCHQDLQIVQLAGVIRCADFFDKSGLDFLHFMEEIFDKTALDPIHGSYHLTHRTGDVRKVAHWNWHSEESAELKKWTKNGWELITWPLAFCTEEIFECDNDDELFDLQLDLIDSLKIGLQKVVPKISKSLQNSLGLESDKIRLISPVFLDFPDNIEDAELSSQQIFSRDAKQVLNKLKI